MGYNIYDERQVVKIFEARMQGLPAAYIRRFYLLRTFEDEELLDYDEEEKAGFMLWWARRYNKFSDSGLHYSITDQAGHGYDDQGGQGFDDLTWEETSVDLANRPPTPDHRANPGRTPPSITPSQRKYWDVTQEMPTAKGDMLDTKLDTRLVSTAEVEMMEQDDGWMSGDGYAETRVEPGPATPRSLPDRRSPRRSSSKIPRPLPASPPAPRNCVKLKLDDISNGLLRGLEPPASPGPSGVKGEKILPGSQPWKEKSTNLSPHAKPFVPLAPTKHPNIKPANKRLNTTSTEELACREIDISDTDILVGDDARHGINMEQIGDEMMDTLKEEDMMDTMSNTLVPEAHRVVEVGVSDPSKPDRPTGTRNKKAKISGPLFSSNRSPRLGPKRGKMF